MALRVLLADESSTIKKVISLALQDFAVEVKVVQSGVDVVEVAKQFNPDIIFADVLLQKKNGYEVCFDIKNDVALTQTPVILMWSSFMDLDEKAFLKSKANAKLEKPFEVEDLRKLVNTFASKTREQTASGYLKFPSGVTEPLKNEQSQKRTLSEDTFSRLGIPAPPQNSRVSGNVSAPISQTLPPKAPQHSPPPVPPSAKQNIATHNPSSPPPKGPANWNMDSFEDIDDFVGQEAGDDDDVSDSNSGLEDFSIAKLSPPVKEFEGTVMKDFNLGESLEGWEQKDLSKFKIDTSDEADPFALMDLGKVELTKSGIRDSQIHNGPPPAPNRTPPPPPKVVGKPEEEFNSFDFADSDAEPLNLELDEVELPPPQTKSNNENSSWNFQLPEHEVSPIKPGDIVELPPEFSHSGKKIVPEEQRGSLAEAPPRQEKPHAPPVARPPTTKTQLDASAGNLDASLIEKIVREQTRELVEKLVQRILPDMAKQLIQKELDRLLSEDTTP